MGGRLNFISLLSHHLTWLNADLVRFLNFSPSKENCLKIVKRGDMRLLLSNIGPGVRELVAKHHYHPSH